MGLLIVFLAYLATWSVIRLPGIPTFQGHETVAWLYLGHATIVGVGLSLVLHVGLIRGLVVAYAAMGIAGLVTLAFVTFAVFAEGYVKDGSRLWASFAFLVAANLIAGTTAVAIGLRRSLLDAFLTSFGALLAIPFVAPLTFGVLTVIQGVGQLMRTR